MENRIRVFISYSHEDKKLVSQLEQILRENNLNPVWTDKLSGGSGFDDQIKMFIENAHIFMPVITKKSSIRGWVHQEIGFAMALHIPVFPVTTEDLTPGGMLQMIQTTKLDMNHPEQVKVKLGSKVFEALLLHENKSPLWELAQFEEERAVKMKEYSTKANKPDYLGMVRQKGGLSSFHIPDIYIWQEQWENRYFPDKKSPYHKKVQREERQALESHASGAGCKLIVNTSYVISEERSKTSIISRINALIGFLESGSGNKAIIAFQGKSSIHESVTIVGDLFLAESTTFKNQEGFTNTFFTRNASEISRRIKDFDDEMNDLLKEKGWTPVNSRGKAIEELKQMLNKFKS
ncbi:MAG: toll/interleukin-1 receptor domain-containing protein [Bacteroidales bacterium]|nr:toll/interleukin-1 receptor domain-containing protein [Bacteroidales bacterium]